MTDFKEKFERYYEKRSAATHGGLNPLILKDITQARNDANDLKSWVKQLLIPLLKITKVLLSQSDGYVIVVGRRDSN